MSMDFNDAEPQGQGGNDTIPEGTVAPVRIHLRGLKKAATSQAQGLDIEYTVMAGPYAKRKAWSWNGVAGNDSDGHKQMVNITRSFVRGVLESAYGIDPADASDAARAARTISDWSDIDGLEFVARFRVEAGKDYTNPSTGEVKKGKDKNVLSAVTPDDPDYKGFKPARPKAKAGAAKATNGAAASQGNERPAWA